MLNHCMIMASSKPTITVEPTMIERSTMGIMVVRNSDQGDSSKSGGGGGGEGRRRRRREGGGYSEGTGRKQWGYSESTVRIQ